jgi:hypothetical protein
VDGGFGADLHVKRQLYWMELDAWNGSGGWLHLLAEVMVCLLIEGLRRGVGDGFVSLLSPACTKMYNGHF